MNKNIKISIMLISMCSLCIFYKNQLHALFGRSTDAHSSTPAATITKPNLSTGFSKATSNSTIQEAKKHLNQKQNKLSKKNKRAKHTKK